MNHKEQKAGQQRNNKQNIDHFLYGFLVANNEVFCSCTQILPPCATISFVTVYMLYYYYLAIQHAVQYLLYQVL